MSSSRSPRCLICAFTRTTRQRPPRRPFHTTGPNLTTTSQPEPSPSESKERKLAVKKGPKALDSFFAEVKAKLRENYTPEQLSAALDKSSYNVEEKATLEKQSPEKLTAHLEKGIDTYTRQQKMKLRNRFTPDELAAVLAGKESMSAYTIKDKAQLKERYTPEQFAAIEAGEKSIDLEDMQRAQLRVDAYMLPYLDDLATVDNIVDKPIRAPYENHDPAFRFKSEDELEEELADFVMEKFDEEGDGSDFEKFWDDMRFTVGKESVERNPRSALAPALPVGINADNPPDVVEEQGKDGRSNRPVSEQLQKLMLQTGFSSRTISNLRCKVLVNHIVVNQTRLGKIRSIYCLAVAGNENGLIGIGEGKAAEFEAAATQARNRAIRSMQPILRYEDRTIFGDVEGKVGAVELKLYHRPPGFGIRCAQYIYEIARCAGIHDLSARVNRSRNPMNTVKAAVQALMKQRDPEQIARARGKKLVDVRKVYNAGSVP